MRSSAKFGGRLTSQAGFTLAEMVVVLAIIGVVAGIAIPPLSRTIDSARLKGASQTLAAIYQDARLRATQNNQTYEIIVSPVGVSPAQACVDLDGDGQCGAGDPSTAFAGKVTLNNNGVPQLLTQAVLGFAPRDTASSVMHDQQDDLVPGLAWSGLGVPCEKPTAASRCNSVGWVQYLQFQRDNGEILYSAVTVSPTGRVKTWVFNNTSGNGNGSWL